MVGGKREAFQVELEAMLRRHALQHRDRRFDDLRTDPVSGDHRDAMALHSKPVARPQPAQ